MSASQGQGTVHAVAQCTAREANGVFSVRAVYEVTAETAASEWVVDFGFRDASSTDFRASYTEEV